MRRKEGGTTQEEAPAPAPSSSRPAVLLEGRRRRRSPWWSGPTPEYVAAAPSVSETNTPLRELSVPDGRPLLRYPRPSGVDQSGRDERTLSAGVGASALLT